MKKIFGKTFFTLMLGASISCSNASTPEREEESATTTKSLTSTHPVVNTEEVRLFALGNEGNNNLVAELDLTERREISFYKGGEENPKRITGSYYKPFTTMGNKLFLASATTNSISEIDSQSRQITKTYAVERPTSITTINQKVFAIGYEDDSIYEIDPQSQQLTQYYPYSFGANPEGLKQIEEHSVAIKLGKKLPFQGFKSLAAVGNKLWVAYFLLDTLSEIDTQSRKVTHTYNVEKYPYAFAISGGKVFVGHNDPFVKLGTITEIDIQSRQIIHIYKNGIDTNIESLAATGNKLFSISRNKALKEIDIQSRQVTYTYPVEQPTALEVIGQKLFLAQGQGNNSKISEIDIQNWKVNHNYRFNTTIRCFSTMNTTSPLKIKILSLRNKNLFTDTFCVFQR